MSTLRDMNLSKLVAQDVPLFLSLLSDLFPALGMPAGMEHAELKRALTTVVEAENLVMHPSWSIKVPVWPLYRPLSSPCLTLCSPI